MPEPSGARPRFAVWTIGHSNHTPDRLLQLLHENGITAIADVRTRPYSAYSNQFNKEQLQRLLVAAGIQYVFLGVELGGRPADAAMYDEDGRVRYDLVASSTLFEAGISRLLRGTASYRVALLCGEEDPISCHRRRLVGRVLSERGISVEHIRGNGTVVGEGDVAARESIEFPDRFQMTLDGAPPWRSQHAVQRQPAAGGDGWSDS